MFLLNDTNDSATRDFDIERFVTQKRSPTPPNNKVEIQYEKSLFIFIVMYVCIASSSSHAKYNKERR